MRNYVLFFSALLLLALASCNNSKEPNLADQEVQLSDQMKAMLEAQKEAKATSVTSELNGTFWKLIKMEYEGEEFPLRPEPEESLQFVDFRIMGGGCRRFSGIFTSESEGVISVNNFNSPFQKCPSAVAPQERRLHEIMQTATSYELRSGSMLTIQSEKGTATFAKP